jgi:hypothetical protein
LKKSIHKADFIIVMYDVNVPASRAAVGNKWLPLIRSCRDAAGKRMVCFFVHAFLVYFLVLCD